MTSHIELAHHYLKLLEQSDTSQIIEMFAPSGAVISPRYGTLPAHTFYTRLAADTANSKLQIKGIFQDSFTQNIALYFHYQWTLQTSEVIHFDVVDIIEFDDAHKITKLTIVYDTASTKPSENQ